MNEPVVRAVLNLLSSPSLPEDLDKFPKIVEKCMEDSASKYCKSVPVPAVAEVGGCWVH